MAIKHIKKAIIIDYADINRSSDSNALSIVENTANTWQVGRSQTEKRADTEFGKLAEDAVICVFNNLGINNYYSYDSFRNDNFKSHAPFDGVFTENLTNRIIFLINNGVATEGAKLSAQTREKLRANNVLTVEVKGTRLTDKYKNNAGFSSYNNDEDMQKLVTFLSRYDFITYPYFIRCGNLTFAEYCEFAEKRINSGKNGDELKEHIRQIELANASDIYVRVFVDEREGKALIMGWIDRRKLFSPPELKKLIQPGKSDVPIYFAKPLLQGESLTALKQILSSL